MFRAAWWTGLHLPGLEIAAKSREAPPTTAELEGKIEPGVLPVTQVGLPPLRLEVFAGWAQPAAEQPGMRPQPARVTSPQKSASVMRL
jgi:hypothetical protein